MTEQVSTFQPRQTESDHRGLVQRTLRGGREGEGQQLLQLREEISFQAPSLSGSALSILPPLITKGESQSGKKNV